MKTLFSNFSTLAALVITMAGATATSVALADEVAAPATTPDTQTLKSEIKQDRIQVKADRAKLKADKQANGAGSPQVAADKAQLHSDLVKTHALMKQRHEAKAQAKEEAGVPVTTSSQQ